MVIFGTDTRPPVPDLNWVETAGRETGKPLEPNSNRHDVDEADDMPSAAPPPAPRPAAREQTPPRRKSRPPTGGHLSQTAIVMMLMRLTTTMVIVMTTAELKHSRMWDTVSRNDECSKEF